MADPRFFIDSLDPTDDTPGATHRAVGSPGDLHHMVHVARVAPGEYIQLVTRGDWRAYACTVVVVEHGAQLGVFVTDTDELARSTDPFMVTVAFGLAKGDKTDTIVRQAVELGVDRIVPVTFQRSIVRLSGDKVESRRDRLQSIAESAAKQSHQGRVPDIDAPCQLDRLVAMVADHDLTLVAWEETVDNELSAVVGRLTENPRPNGGPLRVLVVVGPEGGIEAGEVDRLVAAGAVAVSLGPTILRVDTASAVALGVTFDSLRRAHRNAG